ncbi:MAG: hypothetical protein LBI81_03695 [Puniceicoccales bacterium]|jgi:hypothetical protein|nr:hypothetical protein [Puniceicoccales bacterium]
MKPKLQEQKAAEREYFCPASPAEWRLWLEKNGAHKREIWVLIPHKSTNKPRVSYMEAIGEAICFGWIDGMIKRYDAATVSHRFSPRTAKTSWSEVNKHHARLLIEAGKMTPAGFAVLPDLSEKPFACAPDILSELQKDPLVWKNFCAFPEYYRSIRIAAIEACRDWPERFFKALSYFAEQTRRNRRYGRFK